MPLTFEEVLKSVFKKTIEDVLNEREQRIKTDDNKQDALESGVNIKTVNNQSVLGAGNIDVSGAENIYEIQLGDIVPIEEVSSGAWEVQLSPTMLSVITEFHKRIDFTDPSAYEIDSAYQACTPMAQTVATSEMAEEHLYVYQTRMFWPLYQPMGVVFRHITKEDGVAVDKWFFMLHLLDEPWELMFNVSGFIVGINTDGNEHYIGGYVDTNYEVSTSDWKPDNTYADFPYRAPIGVIINNANADCVFEVVFDVPEATSGNYAPVCNYDPKSQSVYIWAKEVPAQAITIPLIKQIL